MNKIYAFYDKDYHDRLTINLNKYNNLITPVKIYLDTGADLTVLSQSAVSKLTGLKRKELKARDTSYVEKRRISSYSGHSIIHSKVMIRDIIIGGCHFKEFYAYVALDDYVKDSLFGLDYIRQCNGSIRNNEGIVLEFNKEIQEQSSFIYTDKDKILKADAYADYIEIA